MYSCHGQGGNQAWTLTKGKELRHDDICVDGGGSSSPGSPKHHLCSEVFSSSPRATQCPQTWYRSIRTCIREWSYDRKSMSNFILVAMYSFVIWSVCIERTVMWRQVGQYTCVRAQKTRSNHHNCGILKSRTRVSQVRPAPPRII